MDYGSQRIFRVPKQRGGDPWTGILNDTLRDPRLTMQARGILAWALSHSKTWRIRTADIVRAHDGNGEHAVRSALKLLVDLGYAAHLKPRGPRGRLYGTEWKFYEVPIPKQERHLRPPRP